MPTDQLERKLVEFLEDDHAMERSVLVLLDSMIATTGDARMRSDLRRHRSETERHLALLEERLAAHGAAASTPKDVRAVGSAFRRTAALTGPGHGACDAFAAEQLQVAAYELLERVAVRAGDRETAAVARRIRDEEQAMADRLRSSWDAVVAMTLGDPGGAPAEAGRA